MKLIQILSLAVCLTICLSKISYSKGVGESMKDFWHGSGGVSNYNGPSAHEAQAAGYYTMGSTYARTPVKNTQIAGINMPTMKAGCGGINMHNGGFSFINGEEMQKLLKAIANNSSGFALQLAMETISPVIAEKIEELQTWIQRVNAMNINSCETAASLVGGMWPRHERASQTICSTLANGSGIASDFAQARHNCHADKAATHRKIRAKDEETYDKLMVEDINLAWKAIKESGFIDFKDNGDGASLAELFMTLSGTIIIKNINDIPKYEFINGRAAHNDTIQVLMEGGEIKYHSCDETEKCLNVKREGGSYNISSEEAFKAKVEKMIFGLIEKIKADEALTSDEKNFLNNKAQIPIYKILNVYAAYSGSGSLFELPVYTEAIALQIMFEYLNDILRQIDLASENLIISSHDHFKKFKDNIRNVRKALAERELKTHQSYATLVKLVERTTVIEGVLAKQFGSPIAESFQWSKGL